jgi:hypothetical protein
MISKLLGNKKPYIVVIVCYSMEKTTIQISFNTLERLKSLKRFERESYDEVINFVTASYEDEELTAKEIDEIQIALEEVKKGEVYSIEDVAKELGVTLG